VPAGTWVYPGSNEQPDDALIALAKHGVVLLGETHDQAAHHRWQLHTIAALFSHRPDMVLGFEMFRRRVQPVLNRWSNGELNESDFLREVDWPQIWGFCRQALPAAVPFRPNASLADAGAQYRSSDQPSGCGTRTSIRAEH